MVGVTKVLPDDDEQLVCMWGSFILLDDWTTRLVVDTLEELAVDNGLIWMTLVPNLGRRISGRMTDCC